MENTIYGKHSKDSNMRMKLDDQEEQASTRTYDDSPNVLFWFFVPLLALGSILCIVFGMSNSIEDPNRDLNTTLCVLVGPALMAIVVFLITGKIFGPYESSLESFCASMFSFLVLMMSIATVVDIQQQNKTINTREESMSEQGYENLDKRGESTYYAEKDVKEYLLIVNEM